MPILFADKRKRFVAAIHCCRKGLEKGIRRNSIKIFDKIGSHRKDIIVAIGPSISKENYLVDKKTLKEFYKNVVIEGLKTSINNNDNKLNSESFAITRKQALFQLDLQEYAYYQILLENINNNNIEISNICTFDSKEFFSWRENTTSLRQWSFISS